MERETFRQKATEATLCFIIQDGEALLIEKKRGVGEGLFNGPGGELEFIFGSEPFMFVHIFKAEDFSGKPEESEEARPEWFKTSELPYDEMWPDDKHWIPKMLNGEKFTARFNFDEDGDEIQSHRFEEPKF